MPCEWQATLSDNFMACAGIGSTIYLVVADVVLVWYSQYRN